MMKKHLIKIFSVFFAISLACGVPLIVNAAGEYKVHNDTDQVVKVIWLSEVNNEFPSVEEELQKGETKGHAFHADAQQNYRQITIYPKVGESKQYTYKVKTQDSNDTPLLVSKLIAQGTCYNPSDINWDKIVNDAYKQLLPH